MSISARQAFKLLAARAKNKNLQVLDVRTVAQRNALHIPNSQHIPLDQIEKQIQKLQKSETYLVYCRSGKRSLVATEILKKNGLNAINMQGGILEWEKLSAQQKNKPAQQTTSQSKKAQQPKDQSKGYCNLI